MIHGDGEQTGGAMPRHSKLKQDDAVPEGILHPGTRCLFTFWNGLRGQRSAPSRREIEPRQIAPILPWIGIMERPGTSRCHRWRLAGTGIVRLWGGGLTGSAVAAGWPDMYRCSLLRALDGVYDRREPFVARLKAASACGEMVGLEFFAAPVECSDGASVHTLCAVMPFCEPYWLGHDLLVDMELSTIIAIWTNRLPDEISGLSNRSARSVPLRLVQGGRAD